MVQFGTFKVPGAKNGPKNVKNGQKRPKMGMDKWPFFEKTYPSIWLKLAQNIIFGPIIMMKKVSAFIFMKNFSRRQKRDSWSCSHAYWDKRSYGPDIAIKGLK